MSRTALFAALVLVNAAPAANRAKPNIVILLADDMGYADAGFQGCKDVPTPSLDALAKTGVRCTSGYVSCPYCSPTRAGLLTGRYQTRFGHEFNPGAQAVDFGLPLSETTMADRLKGAGYATGLVGKWHLGDAARFHPQKRGFTEYYGFLGGAHPYFPGMGAPIFRGTDVAMENDYLTDAFAREAVGYIDRHKAEPFFLYLAFNAVHTPMHATDDRLKRFTTIADKQRQTYAAMLTAMDEAIGRVLDKLRAENLDEDTLVFFFSDNGGPTMRGTTINGSINTPLRGSKRTTLEGGVRVPFVVRWPGRVPGGTTYSSLVIQLDILPTALAAAGAPVTRDANLHGVNLLPYLNGDERSPPHDTLYWRFGQQMAIRRGDWKLVRYDQAADGGAAGVATPPKLYNLATDIGEANDLGAREPARVQELQAAWDAWDLGNVTARWGGGGAGPGKQKGK